MTKFGDYINQKVQEQRQAREARRSQTERDKALLPPDLTGQVYLACRAEAARVRDRIITLETAIDELRPQLAASRENEKAARIPVYNRKVPGQRRHDILFDDPGSQMAVKMESGVSVRGEDALKIHKQQVQPLVRRLRACEFEILQRQQELHELRKIAEAASAGSVVLIHRLSDKWRARLEIGSGIEGIPTKSVWTDAAGYPLPPAALSGGMPDIPASGRVQESGALVIG